MNANEERTNVGLAWALRPIPRHLVDRYRDGAHRRDALLHGGRNIFYRRTLTGQIHISPDIDTEKTVTRQHEMRHLGYYGFANYWGGSGLWGNAIYPNMVMPGYPDFVSPALPVPSEAQLSFLRAEAAQHQDDDPHLRSCKAVMGYTVLATDGDIGHIQGVLVDEATWAIRYLIVRTSNWWLDHRVIVAAQWIKDVSWSDEIGDSEFDSAGGERIAAIRSRRATGPGSGNQDPRTLWASRVLGARHATRSSNSNAIDLHRIRAGGHV